MGRRNYEMSHCLKVAKDFYSSVERERLLAEGSSNPSAPLNIQCYTSYGAITDSRSTSQITWRITIWRVT